MFTVREDEPGYAKLKPVNAALNNAFGNPIDLIACSTVAYMCKYMSVRMHK